MKPRIKICCIKNLQEASKAIEYGASAIGLVGPMPSGPGTISLDQANEIANSIPENISSFYLTSKTSFEDIRSEYEKVRSSHIQLTDHTDAKVRKRIKKYFPKLKLVQVVHIHAQGSIDDAIQYMAYSDFLLLDSGSPKGQIKELGGTGRIHNWNISKEIVKSLDIPVFLAGGLKADNIKQAIQTVEPYGIDLCSGIRTNDTLDDTKLKSFFDSLKF